MTRNIGIIGTIGISVLGLSACGGVSDEMGEEHGSHTSALETRAPGVEPDEIDFQDERDPTLGGGREIDHGEREPQPGVEPDELVSAQAFPGDVPTFVHVLPYLANLPGAQIVGNLLKALRGPQGGNTPSQILGGNGKLKEIEVAHIGGNDSGNPPLVVTVAGTGAVGVLSSFRASDVAAVPVHLHDSPRLLGHNHQLRVLRPEHDSKSAYRLLLSARIANDKLWLSTWRIGANGAFQLLDTLGYGVSVGVDVADYTLTHRSLANDSFQVVTPVVHGTQMRLVTWQINGATGKIAGKFQSDDVAGVVESGSDLSASLNPGDDTVDPHFVVAYQTSNDRLRHTLWNVTNGGVPELLRGASSGRDIRNDDVVNTNIENVTTIGINGTGHVTASTWNGELGLQVWEDSTCADDVCEFMPLSVSTNERDLNPGAHGVQQGANALPQPNTLRVFLRDPIANVDRFVRNPDVVQAIASVRKVMVTIVALDAVRAEEVSLDDEVTVSAAAANVNNFNVSSMGLQEGEKITLRDLLYGNMMVSAGDATWAISEHVAGNLDNMLQRMNDKATDLGMSNTFHCQRGSAFSAVSYSTARDQTTLWESVFDDELFLEFAGEDSRLVCGTLGNAQICHPAPQAQPMLNPSLFNYPNMDGYKTGGGGGKCQDLAQYANTPTCPSGGCLALQTTRIGRPLVLTELQPEWGAAPFRWTDSYNLQDWAFRAIFTPDFRGDSGAQAGNTADFGIDGVSDLHAVSAVLTGGPSFKVCNWATDAQGGDVDQSTCLTHQLPALSASTRELRATRLQMVQLSSLLADADYLLGHLDGDALQLQLWRVGQRGE